MNMNEAVDFAKYQKDGERASLEFCVSACSILLSDKCEDVSEVNYLREMFMKRIENLRAVELKRYYDLDNSVKERLGSAAEIIGKSFSNQKEHMSEIFDGIVQLK